MTDISSGQYGTGSAFRIGDVVDRSVAILMRNLLPFCFLTGLATLPYLYFYWSRSLAPLAPARVAAGMSLPFIIGFLLRMLAQAAILYGAFQDMRRRPVSIGESFGVGFSRVLPVIGVAICSTVGVALGMILLIVPGIILMTMWYVALPACVVENLGPFQSLGRSAALTQGHRWKIFGLLLLVGVGGLIVGAGIPLLGRLIAGRVGFVVLQYLTQVVVAAFSAVLGVVVYRDLRVAKEGVTTDQIAAVFD